MTNIDPILPLAADPNHRHLVRRAKPGERACDQHGLIPIAILDVKDCSHCEPEEGNTGGEPWCPVCAYCCGC